jgi:hypothetical protein
VEYFHYLSSIITDDEECERDITFRIALGKAAFNEKENLFTSKFDLNSRWKVIKFYIWRTDFYGTVNWTLQLVHPKALKCDNRGG